MKKKILHHTSIMIIFAVLVTFLAASVVTYNKLNTYMQRGVREEAQYICLAMDEYGDSFLTKKLQTVSSSRVTLIRKDGTVLYDSEASPKKLANHSDRPEFIQAEKNGKSESIRYSETFAKKTFYYAVKLDDGNVLRVGKTVDSIYSTWISSLAVLGLLMLLVLIMEFVFAQRQTRELIRPVNDLDLEHPLNNVCYEELRPLLVRVDEQNRQIRQQVKELKEAEEIRKEFSANVSHELKTPITSIRVLADSLMSMEEVPAELYREFMADISDEVDRENQIITDLLTLVKMDKSAQSQTNINEELELILKRLRPIAKRSNVELILESIREVTGDVDRVKFSLAVSNLVENAIKYNVDSGWVRVTLDADHKYFYIRVADSGIGIPQDCMDHIFERFFRVDKARSREVGGTGLGLAITLNVIQMHHGIIDAESTPGEGTTFSVRIPLNYVSRQEDKS